MIYVKEWRSIRQGIVNIFPDDSVKYKMLEEQFEITGKSFVMEELDKLIGLCKNNKLWFYSDIFRSDKMDMCMLVVYKI